MHRRSAGVNLVEVHSEISKLLDKHVYVQKEYFKKILRGFTCGAHASPRKVCDENETRIRIRRKKTTGRLRLMLMNGGQYKALSEDWLNRFGSTLGH